MNEITSNVHERTCSTSSTHMYRDRTMSSVCVYNTLLVFCKNRTYDATAIYDVL